MKLRLKDKVMMMAGRDKGKTGEIVRVIPATAQIVADGLGVVKKHTKPSTKNPRGGILEVARPIATSKVALVCPSCKAPTRVGYQVNGQNKERMCRKCKALVK